MIHHRKVATVVALLLTFAHSLPAAEPAAKSKTTWQAGVSRVVITPAEPMWMSGYGGRSKPAEGKLHDLWAKAVALKDPTGKTAVFVSTDLITVPIKMVDAVMAEITRKHGIGRSEVMFTCSHTHCGPAVDDMLSYMLDMKDSDWRQVRSYQKTLNANLVTLISSALKDLKPAAVSFGNGRCHFAANRRVPRGIGPYDHDVPVLRIGSPDGKTLRAVVFGYACHNTVMSYYKWSGDYAGFAQLYLEGRHPGVTALFFAGCGADQNPLPRRREALAEKYGRMLGVAVDRVLSLPTTPVSGRIATRFENIELTFDNLPKKEELIEVQKTGNRYKKAWAGNLLKQYELYGRLLPTYPYPIQSWQIGPNLTWVALGGEVVVDYAVSLKKLLGHHDPNRSVWVAGYSNDVMAYIASERVLEEGGYEGDTSMIYYQKPSKWRKGLEKQILDTVVALTADNRTQAARPAQLPGDLVFDGKTLAGWTKTKFGGEAEVVVRNGQLILETGADMTGITWNRAKPPPEWDYEVTLDVMRVEGHDFFCGLTFQVGKDPCSLILGGWGGGVCGLSSIDGFDASENDTTGYHEFQNGRWYRVRLRVTRQQVTAWLDGKEILDQPLKGRKLSIRGEVDLSRPFGISTWQTTGAVRNLRLRKLTAKEIVPAKK
ncbi:MAG: neutral/alkaline non-lysosomal ceramidase N-terminal domain-containing protein [Planctomycetota bacterium]|nr:neutral/alkaline non-lysosomal ceramidase N-terminal domain-containing protein [Planctomycetota bacterium]